ncbi:prosaposin-like isoform X2 [Xyrauchen texanus]|uniref:prosaposin-like isoform X2 n=1 Tax=Xyrauchen texanus TaxID=154827 RepID=UPI002242A008|nr:prosaposin-like isoform X2 [Xyrauchen texanus]
MLLTLLFISTAVATPLLGTEQCARGPPYWCQNVKTASLCGAVQHCQQNVWIKPQMKSVPCDLCKEVIVVVEQLLKDNGTESEILGYMEKVCHLIPDTGLAGECQDIVDNYFPILMGIIEGELDNPSVVCGAMGLCVSQQAALAKALLMSNEIPQVDLTQRVNPFLLNIPQLLYPKENVKEETPKQSGDVCQDCVTFITDTQDQAKSNASFVNSLLMQVENQCELLGPGMSDMCKEYISQYGPLVIQQLMSMQPKDICFRAGFCPTGPKSVLMQKLVPAKSIPASKSIPAVKMFPAIKLETPVVAKMMRVRDPPQCAICEYVIKEVEAMLEGQTSEEQIVQVVEKVCDILPSTLTTQCKDLIEAYGKAIIDLLVQEADPKTICGFLGLCNQASRTFIPEMDIAKFQNGGLCDVCKMAVRYVDGIMEQNATQAEIEDAVRKVCKFLPDSVRDECDQLVQQYEPLLVQLLLQTLDPDFICMKLGACPGAVQRLLGLEQCSWGPGYWCKNVETAARCNALDHCRRHVWN